MVRWVGYFEQFYTAGNPSRPLEINSLWAVSADPSIGKAPPSLDEAKKAVANLKG